MENLLQLIYDDIQEYQNIQDTLESMSGLNFVCLLDLCRFFLQFSSLYASLFLIIWCPP